MSKIYLLRACAYRKKFNNMCNVWDYKSIFFMQLNQAVSLGLKILNRQLEKLYETDENKNHYESFDQFLEESAGYIFEIQETDLVKIKNWKHIASDDKFEECHKTIENSPFVIYEYDHRGNLKDRIFFTTANADKFENGLIGGDVGYYFRPNDEKKEAGKKFQLGDIVISNKDNKDKNLYIIFSCPVKKFRYFENFYTCSFVHNSNFLSHTHFHEEDITLFSGKVPNTVLWLSMLLKDEIKISETDWQKIYDGAFCFSDLPSYKEIKPNE